jgi:RNA 3'-terminal phosphate cyclase (ATP)
MITVTGGTHNPWAPPYDFLSETFLPAIAKGGFDADCKLIKHGFFPAGGGKVTFNIRPYRQNTDKAIDLCESETQRQIHARIYTARLPDRIAQRQRSLLRQSKLSIENIEHVEVTDSDGPGNCVMLSICGTQMTTVFTAFGAKGKPSEKVVAEVTDLADSFLKSSAAVDRFLADQLLIYMAMSKSGSYTTSDLSTHLTTNIETIKQFLHVTFNLTQQEAIYRISCTLA